MDKQALKLLEKAFAAEVTAAIDGELHLIQTKSKKARQLADDGLLQERTITMISRFPYNVTVTGYELTEAGRLAYCISADA